MKTNGSGVRNSINFKDGKEFLPIRLAVNEPYRQSASRDCAASLSSSLYSVPLYHIESGQIKSNGGNNARCVRREHQSSGQLFQFVGGYSLSPYQTRKDQVGQGRQEPKDLHGQSQKVFGQVGTEIN